MAEGANTSAFDRYHPAVPCAYFTCVLAFTMLAFHPVLTALSLAAALAESAVLRGWRAAGRSLLWLFPVVAVIALANPLFTSAGSTEVFRLGMHAVYAESFAYGACMGAMLAAVVLWFSAASRVLTSGKIMALMANVLPTVTLMVSMAMRLVPQFVRRGAEIRAVQAACMPARAGGRGRAGEGEGEGAFVRKTVGLRERAAANLRLVSVLMGWSMEDSLETADVMRARGWGAKERRTTYARYRFRARDGAALALLAALTCASAFLAWTACSQFAFYPRTSTLVVWWGYLPCVAFLCVPLLLEAEGWLAWR